MGLRAEGKANVKHRPEYVRRRCGDPSLLSRRPPWLYRGGVGGIPYLVRIKTSDRIQGGPQEARRIGRLNRAAPLDRRRCGGRVEFHTYRRRCTP